MFDPLLTLNQAPSVAVFCEAEYALIMAKLLELPVTDWTDCPLIEINPRKLSGTPVLKGTRMPADAILENYADGLPAEEIAEVFELPADSVRALLSYAEQRKAAPKS
jgi:uncharacterized protein (DUF433 family)